MSEGEALDLIKGTLFVAVSLAAPLLIVGLVAGLLVSLFQTITSIQEQSMPQIVKMLAIMACFMTLSPLALRILTEFAQRLLEDLPRWAGG